MSVNCFYFDPFTGVMDGIPVTEGMPTHRNDGSVYKPSVQCDERFILLDTVSAPTVHIVEGQKRVHRGFLRTVHPSDGERSSFDVISGNGRAGALLLVSTRASDRRVTEKATWLNAWEGILADDEAAIIMGGVTRALIQFTDGGQEVDVFQNNGYAHRLRYEAGKVVAVPLTRKEMAGIRVDQLNSQIGRLSSTDVNEARRSQGILWGAARLLRFSAKDAEVRALFVDFLSEHVGQMSERLREEVRSILVQAGDRYAGNFVRGENVVSIARHRSAVSDSKKKSEQKKAERRMRDREARLVMKGASGGGGGNHKSKKK